MRWWRVEGIWRDGMTFGAGTVWVQAETADAAVTKTLEAPPIKGAEWRAVPCAGDGSFR